MRRRTVAVIGFGCALGVFAAGGAAPASAVTTSTVSGGTKTVEYDGYAISVPAAWPVYRLDNDPAQCVRYDINAIYLGNPGTDQACPSNLIGRGATVSISGAGASGVPAVRDQRAAVSQGGLGGAFPAVSPVRRAGSLPAVQATMDQYVQDGEFHATLPHSDVSVTATYGVDPSQVETILRSMRKLPAGAGHQRAARASARHARHARTTAFTAHAPARTLPIKPAATPKPTAKPKPTATPKPTTTPQPSPSPSPKPTPTPGTATLAAHVYPSAPMNGFDTCTAPSLSAMRAWKSKYSAIGVYIGGQDMACDYGNLSASWVRSTHSMGWSLMPIYVGLQAPCNSFRGSINAKSAGSQGKTAADAAIGDASHFGMGKGSPLYFDMEAYNNSNSGCKKAVLTFLDAWTRELHARGYVSGVYSSAASGVSDLAWTSSVNGHSLAEPDSLWFALWDNKNNLVGTPYLPGSKWATHRDKQYCGGRNQKVGRYTLNIDCDRVGGAVSGP
jgi:hypothetical protein